MALTSTEKQKRYRERQKLKAAGLLPEPPVKPRLNLSHTGLSAYVNRYEATDSQAHAEQLQSIDYLQQELQDIDLKYLITGEFPEDEVRFTENLVKSLMVGLESLTALLHEFRVQQIDEQIELLMKSPQTSAGSKERLALLSETQSRLLRNFRLSLPAYGVNDD